MILVFSFASNLTIDIIAFQWEWTVFKRKIGNYSYKIFLRSYLNTNYLGMSFTAFLYYIRHYYPYLFNEWIGGQLFTKEELISILLNLELIRYPIKAKKLFEECVIILILSTGNSSSTFYMLFLGKLLNKKLISLLK